MSDNTQKEVQRFGTSFGTLMVMIGSAVGLGNVWRFPYMTGKYGGGAFLLIYLVCVLLFCIPCLMAEWTLGRSLRKGPIGALRNSGIPKGKWLGSILVFSAFMATSYYTVVVGWTLKYFIASLSGDYAGQNTDSYFTNVTGSFGSQLTYTIIVIGLVVSILYFGAKRGIERVSKYSIPFLFVLLIILALRSVTLPGAGEGLRFFLNPDFSEVRPATFLTAMGQAFFSLGLGATFMLVYSSYTSNKYNIPVNATITAFGDMLACFIAGLVVLPAVYAFGLEPASGPPLTFITLPSVFNSMSNGLFYGSLFFLALFIAALLSDVVAFEVLINMVVSETRLTRKQGLIFFGIVEFLLAIPSMFSVTYIEKSDLLWGSTMQPIGSVLAIIGLAWFMGKEKAVNEILKGSKFRYAFFWFKWIKYVVPVMIALILIQHIITLIL